MKKSLTIISLIFLFVSCQSPQSKTEAGYDGGKKERGVLSEYANKPLEQNT